MVIFAVSQWIFYKRNTMKRTIIAAIALLYSLNLSAWWDPGHLVTAMIAYMQLDETARERVDELTKTLERDYPAVNHFIVTGAWPDDLKAEGVRSYDTWHYTNIPYKYDNVAIPDQPEVDILWAINEAVDVLRDNRSREVDKARHLGFLVHFVADIHQPLHSTSMYTDELPSGNRGGNKFDLKGEWRNLHALWDDGCGFLSEYNEIRPYGEEKQPLTRREIRRLQDLAESLVREFPKESFSAADTLDPDFWAMESHKLAVRYGYSGVKDPDARGRARYLQPGEQPSDYYLEQGQAVVRRQLAMGGYRLGALLNDIFGEGKTER